MCQKARGKCFCNLSRSLHMKEVVDPEDYRFILASIGCDFLRPVKLGDSIALHL